jgi:hypothetical protein
VTFTDASGGVTGTIDAKGLTLLMQRAEIDRQ